jgi:hypothetical protein
MGEDLQGPACPYTNDASGTLWGHHPWALGHDGDSMRMPVGSCGDNMPEQWGHAGDVKGPVSAQ